MGVKSKFVKWKPNNIYCQKQLILFSHYLVKKANGLLVASFLVFNLIRTILLQIII